MSSLPLALTIGFSGPRIWISPANFHPSADPTAIQKAAQEWLMEFLRSLPDRLGDERRRYFLSGLSQIAIGADQAFTCACQALGLPQRIILPQPSDVYVTAGSSAEPDFSEEQKKATLELLKSPHIIQERVVASVPSRELRFEETNIELVRRCDLLVAMIRAGEEGGARGGTWGNIELARRQGVPVVIIRVGWNQQGPQLEEDAENEEGIRRLKERLPQIPEILQSVSWRENAEGDSEPAGTAIPERDEYFKRIMEHCSKQASQHSDDFGHAASVITWTHVTATMLALLALVGVYELAPDGVKYWLLAGLLGGELGLLFWGFQRHHRLHAEKSTSRWAMSRLMAEIMRSITAFGRFHAGFSHLESLHLPTSLTPLLRTMEVLHLCQTARDPCDDWESCRDQYIERRLTSDRGQLRYYERQANKARDEHGRALRRFKIASISAITATGLKLLFVLAVCICHIHPSSSDVIKATLGFFGVILPVLAVAFLSLAAAHDLEARYHTFAEMDEFLKKQVRLLKNADSEREFARLMIETESQLLGETATWYSRRAFTEVA